MNKTIIYTGAFRFPAGDAAASRVLNNAKILKSLGYSVVFISFGGVPQEVDKKCDGNYYYQGFRYINTDDIDIKQPNILRRIISFFFSGRNTLKIINNIITEVEGVIAYQPSSYFTIRILALCKRHNKKFIADLTEWYDPKEFPGGTFAPPAWLNEWNMRHIQKRIKNKIVISSYLDKYYKSSNNIILPPLIDSEEDKWKQFKEVLPVFDGLRVIYAGTPGKKDSLEIMLDAVISCLKDGMKLQFVVVGVTKQDIAHYKNIGEVFLYPDNVLLCGRVPQIEVPSYYNASDFSFLIRKTNRKNMAGFPTKLVESMTAGCPVIVNDTSDIENYVMSGYNGFLLKDFSLDELIKILKGIDEMSSEKVELLKKNAKESALSAFDFRNHLKIVEDFLL